MLAICPAVFVPEPDPTASLEGGGSGHGRHRVGHDCTDDGHHVHRAVELSQAIIVDRRVMQIAGTTADLVARADTQIAQSDITDIMKAGSYIMAPYSHNLCGSSFASCSPRPRAQPT
jgi:hypothetical protein